MKVIDGKIVEITVSELRTMYVERGMDQVMSFDDYKYNFICLGCIVVPDIKDNNTTN